MLSHSRQQYQKELAAGSGSRPATEASIQAEFFEWLSIYESRFPGLALFHSIPNEGNRSGLDGWKRKVTGRKKGIPDTHLPLPSGEYRGLWLEFKSATGRVTTEQQKWIELLRSFGHRVEVVRSWVDAANVTIAYLSLPLEKL